ncbi:DUF5681 domain-containing protein [uncultured Boseongicola sp.]|uniref:DUF5681 domain-containing protein n=1 Tax=uncultured Boseongicola sp. TaxID=1648499 RepID=UPI00262A3A0E|nr:DUF5681 domain-containing protein [uncultured Boseongicola sp.]
MADEYEVGHGKPPKNTQWSKGQSGNPKGRRKTKHEFLKTYAEILSEPVTAKTPNGNSISLGSLEAAYFSMCKKALNGDNAALFSALKIMLEILPKGPDAQEKRESGYGGAKEKLMEMAGLSANGDLFEN